MRVRDICGRLICVAGAVLLVGSLASCGPSPETADPSTSASPHPSGSPSAESSPQPSPSSSTGSSDVGGIVDGFPSSVIPVPTGATVLLSTVTPTEGGLDTVSLSIDSTDSSADLMAFYANSITAAGFAQIPPGSGDATAPSTQQETFSRGDSGEMLQVTVLDDGSVRHVTVGGRIAPGTQ